MSKSSFDSKYQEPLLARLEIEMRTKVEGQKGQLLVLPGPDQLKKAIIDTFGESTKIISDHHYREATKAARAQALKLHNLYKNKEELRYAVLKNKLPDLHLPRSWKLEQQLFVVRSFRYSIDSVKKKIVEYFKKHNLLTTEEGKKFSRNLHKGHGVKGSAVSQVQIASAMATIAPEDIESLGNAFEAYAAQVKLPSDIRAEIGKLVTRHTQIVDPQGNLRDDYLSSVNFQVGTVNIGRDASYEKAVKAAFRDFATDYTKDLVNADGSSTLKQKITRALMENLSGKPLKNKKVTSPDRNAERKTQHKSTKEASSSKVGAATIIRKRSTRKRQTASATTPNLGAILGILQDKLPQTVAKNMGSPRLNNRTGRFAGSVQVTDMAVTAKGFPSIGYTYMKRPYQTFETGGAQGSADRDPRTLIDTSIREIAAGLAMGRFYTRRV